MTDTTIVTLQAHYIERLLDIADRAGVKHGTDIVGPHDTVIVETVRSALRRAKASA